MWRGISERVRRRKGRCRCRGRIECGWMVVGARMEVRLV